LILPVFGLTEPYWNKLCRTLKFIHDLDEEAQRTTREGLSEETLPVRLPQKTDLHCVN
jgi:hypothetical protein